MAGAGSGKTAVLSERVIYKLHQGIHVDELLILTFTRAAAEEMKDRIRKKISKDETLKDELDRLESSYITTFDSFALSVAKKYHYMLNLPSDIGIAEETIVSLEKSKILDKVFDRFYEEGNEQFEALIRRYSLKNDSIIKEAILGLANKIENFIDRDAFLKYLEDFYDNENLDKIVDEFKAYVNQKKKTLALELENAYHYFESDYNEQLDNIILPILNTKTLDELASYKSAKLPNLKRGADEEAKAVKELVKVSLNELLSLTELGNEEKIKKDILSTSSLTSIIKKILGNYYEELDKFKTEKSIYTFSDIANLSIRILKENENARLELKDKFKEIMIDEYQDTNDIQEAFISLIANNNVYMVGDIKQSIYRFRGSNPSIFKDKYDKYSKGDDGAKIDLIKNFRSRKEVLDNINRIFDLIMDDNLGGAAYTVSHEMVYGNLNYDEKKFDGYDYNFEVLEYEKPEKSEFSNSEIEIFTIANDILNKKKMNLQVFDKETEAMRPFKFSDAVIILDRSKYFDDFKKVFEHLGIPLTILKDDKLTTSLDLFILKNLIDLLVRIKTDDYSESFKYDFMSIGRSFLYEYSDEYLFDIISNNKFKDTTLYKDLYYIEDYNSKTIKELLLDILDKTDFYNKLYKVGDYKNTTVRIDKIIELATNLGNVGYSIENFRDYLNTIIEEGLEIKYTSFHGDADSVKILTIHKSKGLEYPVCYFADLDHDFNTRELKDKFIADKKYGLISAIETEGEDDTDSVLKILYKDSFLKNEIGEKIRLFYVALTRAREKMIIVLPKKDTKKLEKNEIGTIEEIRRLKFKSLGDFIYGVRDYLSTYFKTVDLNTLNMSKDYLYTKTVSLKTDTSEQNDFVVEEINIEKELVQEKSFSKSTIDILDRTIKENMNFGTKVHETLEYIDFKNIDKINIEDSFLKKEINKLLDNKLFENINNAKIYKEFEFVYEKDFTEYHGIIDLMLEYEDHIDIVDYKLKNTVDEKYKDQLNGYKTYISSITDKPINVYLYSILNGTVTEI